MKEGNRIAEDGETAYSVISAAETPAGYLRFELYEGAAGMGTGMVNSDYPEVIREIDVAEWQIVRKLGFIPQPGRIKLITGRGPSMEPLILDGDVLMIDTWIQRFEGDGVYLINLHGSTQIKKLQMRSDGLNVVSSNKEYPAFAIRGDDAHELHIGGRVLTGVQIRSL